jgi:hypothetical protein
MRLLFRVWTNSFPTATEDALVEGPTSSRTLCNVRKYVYTKKLFLRGYEIKKYYHVKIIYRNKLFKGIKTLQLQYYSKNASSYIKTRFDSVSSSSS